MEGKTRPAITDNYAAHLGWKCFLFGRGRVWVHHLSLSSGPPPKWWSMVAATADFHSCSGWPSFLLFVYVCKWVAGKKPLLEWLSAVVATADCHSSSGHYCWLPFQWWSWTQAQVVNSNSTLAGKETSSVEATCGIHIDINGSCGTPAKKSVMWYIVNHLTVLFTKPLARHSPSWNDLRDLFLLVAPFMAYGSFRNCTRQNHGTSQNCEAGSFVNSAVRHKQVGRNVKVM